MSISKEEWLRRFKEVHGDTYDYSEVEKLETITQKTKIPVICKKHGIFYQGAKPHYAQKQGCPICAKEKKKQNSHNYTNFLESALKRHGENFDFPYIKEEYENSHSKITVRCKICGTEYQKIACDFITSRGGGCPTCRKTIIYNKPPQRKLRSQEKLLLERKNNFIKQANEIHSNKYDYSKIEYINNNISVCIVCPKHGEFWQKPYHHTLRKKGCPQCQYEKQSLTLKDFIIKAKKVHRDKYDYSKVIYKNYHTKVLITCPIHGEFWQYPCSHIHGSGCPICSESTLEKELRKLFDDNKINYIYGYHNKELLGRLELDFFIPELHIAIECQGKQHFYPVDYFGGEEAFIKMQMRDKLKLKICEEHKIKLLYYSNLNIDYPYKVFTDKNKLLEEIKKYESNTN